MRTQELNDLSGTIIGCAFRVHSALGPGLLESAYEHCLEHELLATGHEVQRQLMFPLQYRSIELEAGFRLDMLVDDELILEIKSVDQVLPVHRAQLLTYLKLTERKLGLILNFKVKSMRNGIHRVIRGPKRPSEKL